MALNIKTEPTLRIEESSGVVAVSSDDDDCVIENQKMYPEPKPPERPERPRTPDTHCSICLDALTNKCYSDSCWHMFCFECLKTWSAITASCPLCKKDFKTIFHTFNDQGFHETYVVPLPVRQFSPRLFIRPFSELFSDEPNSSRRAFGVNLFIDLMRRNDRMVHYFNDQNQNLIPSSRFRSHMNISHRDHGVHNVHRDYGVHNVHRDYGVHNVHRDYGVHNVHRPHTNGHYGRVQVYNDNIWAEPLPDISGRYRDCSLEFYRENPSQTHRLHGFILRDIISIRSIFYFEGGFRLGNGMTDEEITNLIMLAVLAHDIRGAFMATYLRPYLGSHTDHFCHELHNYANSPYDMVGYDRNVRYSNLESHSMAHVLVRQNVTDLTEPILVIPESETIILDSSDSDDIVQTSPRQFGHETIVLSSTDDDSEIEILEHHIRPMIDLSNRDQPSTSTGIRDSLPNTRYNLRRRRLYRSANSSGHCSRIMCQSDLRRREVSQVSPANYISSSNDEEPTIPSIPGSTRAMLPVASGIVCKRKKKVKKSKKSRKRTDGSSELRISSTNQPYTDWSSSDESDTRPQNSHTSVCFNIAPRT